MTALHSYKGTCFCGAIEITATGEPVVMGYCHCSSCRHWSASPINAFTLWKPEAIRVTKGAEHLGVFHKTEKSHRKWCRHCGGHVFTEHPSFGLIDVYAATLPELPFHPSLHVHYGETVLPIRDGLPKQKDMPKEMGGSGILIEEPK